MRLRSWLLLTLLAAPVRAGAGTAPGVQVQIDGLGAGPVGKYAFAGGRAASFFYGPGPGPGVMGSVTFGVRQHIVLGVRGGVYRDEKSQDLGPPIGGTIKRKLTAVPVHVISQYRGRLPWWGLSLYGESGIGVVTHTQKLRLDAFTPPFVLAAHQTSFSFMGGAGLSHPIAKEVDLVLSSDYYQALTKRGDAWGPGDNPKAVVVSLGLRFPR